MKNFLRFTALVFLVMFVLSATGCSTIVKLLGAASVEYVDERFNSLEANVQSLTDRNAESIRRNQEALDNYNETAARLENLVESVEQTAQTTEELAQLAVALEQRLQNLPVETIQQLVIILQNYLDGTAQ